jgi:hypothetical protein
MNILQYVHLTEVAAVSTWQGYCVVYLVRSCYDAFVGQLNTDVGFAEYAQ